MGEDVGCYGSGICSCLEGQVDGSGTGSGHRHASLKLLAPFNLSVDIPCSLFKVNDSAVIVLEVSPPDVLCGVSEVEVHVFRDLDALYAGRMIRVMLRVVYFVVDF